MVETETFEEATVSRLAEADVIMAVGFGDPSVPPLLVGRAEFVNAAKSPESTAETKILRVKISSNEEFEELKDRVKEAKGELDSSVEKRPAE